MQRFLRGAVACLLTANAFAIMVVGSDDTPELLPAEQGTRTVTLIQAPDGTTTEVDPATPAGQAAIEQGKRNGATITESTVPAEQAAQEATPSTLANETTPTTGLLPTLPTLPVDPQKTIDDGQDVLDKTVDKIQDTVPTPLDDTVDKVQDTVGGTVDQVQDVLKPVIPTTTTTTKPATTTTTKPVTSVVEDVVDDTVGGVTGRLGL